MTKTKLYITFLAAAVMLFLVRCKKDDASNTTVFVSTSPITNINTASASAEGDVDIVGAEAITELGFCWDVSQLPTIDIHKAVSSSTKTGHFKAQLTGLTAGETYFVRAYAINNGKVQYGNMVNFVASVPLPLIKNGDFELPADASVTDINALPNWKTDEIDPAVIGRGPDCCGRTSSLFVWAYSTSKSFYQLAGKIPESESDYAISFDGNYDWTDWGNYAATIGVIFSAYTGNDPKTRVAIDTLKISTGDFPGWGNNWVKITSSYKIRVGSPYAGQNLVIEFDILPYVDPATGEVWDDTVWYDFDNISVIQTTK